MRVKVCSHSLFFKWRLYIISCVSTAGPKAAVPGPVTFPLSLPGLDRACSWPMACFFFPNENLGPTGARGVVLNKGGVSPRLERISTADHFIK